MFYLTTHSTHFIYGYMATDIWLRTILIVRKEPRCRHISYSFRLTARLLLYAPAHRQDSTYHGLCYTSRGALGGTRNISNRSNNSSYHRPLSDRRDYPHHCTDPLRPCHFVKIHTVSEKVKVNNSRAVYIEENFRGVCVCVCVCMCVCVCFVFFLY